MVIAAWPGTRTTIEGDRRGAGAGQRDQRPGNAAMPPMCLVASTRLAGLALSAVAFIAVAIRESRHIVMGLPDSVFPVR